MASKREAESLQEQLDKARTDAEARLREAHAQFAQERLDHETVVETLRVQILDRETRVKELLAEMQVRVCARARSDVSACVRMCMRACLHMCATAHLSDIFLRLLRVREDVRVKV